MSRAARLDFLAGVLVLGLASCARDAEDAVLGERHHALKVCADGPTVDGIDVSKYQGTIDWNQVAASGIHFAFIRVSDGLTYKDATFAENWAGAREAGVYRGAYQFFRPGQDAVAQAQLLLSIMGPLGPGDLPPVIDVEDTDGATATTIVAQIHQWIDTVEAATGVMPIVYSGKYFWNDNVGSGDFVDYPLWIPQYGPTCPDLPSPWTRWLFFQTSATGRVPGITGAVDTDLFNGSLEDLAQVAVGEPLVCATVPAAGRVVDDSEPCFVAGGDAKYIRHEAAGVGGSLKWTYTTDSASAANYGVWSLSFAEAGRYVIDVSTPAPFANSKQALYQIEHRGQIDTVRLDQSLVDGWSRLFELEVEAGGNQWIRVDDNTGEPRATETQLVFDAIRLTRADLPSPDAGLEVDAGEEVSGSAEDDAGGCRVGRGGASPWVLVPLFWCWLRRKTSQSSPRRSRLRSA
jgi:lysozyme